EWRHINNSISHYKFISYITIPVLPLVGLRACSVGVLLFGMAFAGIAAMRLPVDCPEQNGKKVQKSCRRNIGKNRINRTEGQERKEATATECWNSALNVS